MRAFLSLGSVLLLLSPPGLAQPVEVLFQAVITSEGRACPSVTSVKVLGKSTSGAGVVAAACSDGSRHVIEILPDRSLNYISSCSTFEAVSGTSCF
ncbi:hypothetical protein J7444_19615 [Labrenzia sp. R4_1]|uniref:hypothetical protein n=1 Tax=Labrenzia sp. R4_1 TaxID=2821106 RepID=UPI001ADC0E7B|nr:hypothetical protein [Labrenzia sp. R4_1]MBO9426952.1 hypothetical protein [Labrenzia sp. R4_1]